MDTNPTWPTVSFELYADEATPIRRLAAEAAEYVLRQVRRNGRPWATSWRD